RRILDADADLLHGRDEIGLAVLVLAQHGRKELHQWHPADRRAEVEPGAVAPDLHVEIAAEGRIPALDRRKPLSGPRRAPDQGLQSGGVGGLAEARSVIICAYSHRHEIVTVVPLVSLVACFKFNRAAPPRAMPSRNGQGTGRS